MGVKACGLKMLGRGDANFFSRGAVGGGSLAVTAALTMELKVSVADPFHLKNNFLFVIYVVKEKCL